MSVLRRGAPAAPGRAVPAGSAVYAVGDVHGRADLLAELHEAIVDDAAAHPASRRVLVYLGDYVSRTPGARAVLEALLRAPPPGFERVRLKGNHEDMLLSFLDGDLKAGSNWLTYGEAEVTLAEYGVRCGAPETLVESDYAALRLRLERALPAAHVALLRALSLSHREGGYFFAHAGVRPGVALDAQAARDLMWIGRRFLGSEEDFGAVVVHGHWVRAEPEVRPNRIGIDTGAYASGVLTCLALRGEERAFLQATRAN